MFTVYSPLCLDNLSLPLTAPGKRLGLELQPWPFSMVRRKSRETTSEGQGPQDLTTVNDLRADWNGKGKVVMGTSRRRRGATYQIRPCRLGARSPPSDMMEWNPRSVSVWNARHIMGWIKKWFFFPFFRALEARLNTYCHDITEYAWRSTIWLYFHRIVWAFERSGVGPWWPTG